MATIENFILKFKTEGTNALNAVQDQLAGIGQQAGIAGEALIAVGAKLGPVGAAAGVAAAAFAALGLRAANIADELQDLADVTGISSSALLNFKQSIIEAGGKADSFSTIAGKLNVNIGEAFNGNEKLRKSFDQLGVSVTDSNGSLRDSGAILQDVISRLAGIQDPAERSARAVDLLGKQAALIDWTKVSAINDPFKDKEIEQLSKYRGALDTLANTVETKLVTVFGKLAMSMNDALEQADKIEKKLNEQGRAGYISPGARGTISGLFGLTPREPVITREMTAQEKLIRDMEQQMPQEIARLRARAQSSVAGTNIWMPSETEKKAALESNKRLEEGRAEITRLLRLQGASDLQAIEINSQIDLQKKIADIKSKENLGQKAKDEEIAVATTASKLKLEEDLAKARRQLNAKIAAEEMAQAEQNARELAQYYQQVDQARLQAWNQVDAIRSGTEQLRDRIALQGRLLEAGTIERDRLQRIFDLEQQRKQQLDAISKIRDLPNDERLVREKELNAEFEKRIELINQEADTRARREQDFSAGIRESMRRYEESLTPLKMGQQMADSVFRNMDRALGDFVNNGKFNFKDFANSVIRDLILIELRASTVSLFKNVFGSLGTALGFRAGGGPVAAGQPYVVGERGAELFVPSTGGTIVSNGQLRGDGGVGIGSSNVVYNINAVDASSFKQLVARDPGFIYAVTEQGRKAVPTTRR